MKIVVLFVVFIAVTCGLFWDNERLLSAPQKLNRYQNPPAEPYTFIVKNCGSPSDPTKLYSAKASPDPIVLGKNITVTGSGYLSSTINERAAYTINLEIYKSVLGVWVYIPCVDGQGSCSISDICAKLKPNPHCPLAPYKIPCSCPLPMGSYTIPAPGLSIETHNPRISWLTNGDYEAKATLFNPSGIRMACYSVQASLSAN